MKGKIFIAAIVFTFTTMGLFSQSITPFVIAGGGYGNTGGVVLSWSIGEPAITTITNGTNFVTQGFHQPLNDSTPFIPIDSADLVVYHGMTPNGDNFNDTWVIDGIDTIPNNVSIFNRWGDLVWHGENYDNINVVWKGNNRQGDLLPPATYFYVIILNDKEPIKGWVEVSH